MSDEPITQRDLINAVQAATLNTQITNLVKDVSELKQSVESDVQALAKRIEDHDKAHESERATREARHSANLRWAIGLAVTLLASNGGVIAIVITHLH